MDPSWDWLKRLEKRWKNPSEKKNLRWSEDHTSNQPEIVLTTIFVVSWAVDDKWSLSPKANGQIWLYIYVYICKCISHIIGLVEIYIYIHTYILMQKGWVHVINWRSLADLQWLISKFQKFQILLVREMRMKLHFLESSLCQWLHSVTRHYTVRTCPEKNRASKGKLSPYNPKRFRCKKPEKIIPSGKDRWRNSPLPWMS